MTTLIDTIINILCAYRLCQQEVNLNIVRATYRAIEAFWDRFNVCITRRTFTNVSFGSEGLIKLTRTMRLLLLTRVA